MIARKPFRAKPGSGSLSRSGRPTRQVSMKKRNPKRRVSEWARAYGSAERVAWVRSLPCLVCGPLSFGASQNAHVGTGGVSRKADARNVVPLCAPHHRSLHTRGVRSFEDRYGINLETAAERINALWLARSTPSTAGASKNE